MTVKDEHIPTPFKVHKHSAGIQITGNNDDGCIIAEMVEHIYDETKESDEMLTNAEFIVNACNSHDALIEICQGIMNNLIWVAPTSGSCTMPTELFVKIKQALAQEKGE